MPRIHHTSHGDVPFTPQEEAEWDAREAAEALPSALAAFTTRRDDVVCAGPGVLHEGNRWHTDPSSQHAMASVLELARVFERRTGNPWQTKWKTLTGFVLVDIDALEIAGLVVGAYVQAAFDREDQLITKAQGGDIAGALAEINDGWPA